MFSAPANARQWAAATTAQPWIAIFAQIWNQEAWHVRFVERKLFWYFNNAVFFSKCVDHSISDFLSFLHDSWDRYWGKTGAHVCGRTKTNRSARCVCLCARVWVRGRGEVRVLLSRFLRQRMANVCARSDLCSTTAGCESRGDESRDGAAWIIVSSAIVVWVMAVTGCGAVWWRICGRGAHVVDWVVRCGWGNFRVIECVYGTHEEAVVAKFLL